MPAIVRDMIKIYVIAQESAVILESVQLIADSGYDLDQFSPQRTSRPRPNELPAEKNRIMISTIWAIRDFTALRGALNRIHTGVASENGK